MNLFYFLRWHFNPLLCSHQPFFWIILVLRKVKSWVEMSIDCINVLVKKKTKYHNLFNFGNVSLFHFIRWHFTVYCALIRTRINQEKGFILVLMKAQLNVEMSISWIDVLMKNILKFFNYFILYFNYYINLEYNKYLSLYPHYINVLIEDQILLECISKIISFERKVK